MSGLPFYWGRRSDAGWKFRRESDARRRKGELRLSGALDSQCSPAYPAILPVREKGKKWVRHYGCGGCHEISGMEEEGRIGTELTFEGSKPIERLDFALFTEAAQRGGKDAEPIKDKDDVARLPDGAAKEPWYDHK